MQNIIDFILQLPESIIVFVFLLIGLPLALLILKITTPILNSLKPLPVYDDTTGKYHLPRRPGEKRLAYWSIIVFALVSVTISMPLSALPWWFTLISIGIAMLLTWFASFLGRTKQIWTGGVIGSTAGFILGLLAHANFASTVFSILVWGVGGLLIDSILSRNYRKLRAEKKPTGFWASWGGFKRFGGGSSGGGGASGGW